MNKQSNFTLFSPDVRGQARKQQIFNSSECQGDNVSPQLYWVDVPAGTQSFAITMYDKDAPSGSGWWHWMLFNIPVFVSEIAGDSGNPKAGLLPDACVQSLNDFGLYGYSGPCPPQGDGIHEYKITIYALDISDLGLSRDTNPAMAGFMINAHTIQKASLVMYYQR